MKRWPIITGHALAFLIAAVLYFLFTLPRWSEFAGSTSHTAGTALRVITGALLVFLAAPVLLDLRRVRHLGLRTPPLVVALHWSAIAGTTLAGITIIGIAIAEVPISLDTAGPWFFAGYAGAAMVALLAAAAYYLAVAADPAPKAKPTANPTANPTASDPADAPADAPAKDTGTDTGTGTDEPDEPADARTDADNTDADNTDADNTDADSTDDEAAPVSVWVPDETVTEAKPAPTRKTPRLKNRRSR